MRDVSVCLKAIGNVSGWARALQHCLDRSLDREAAALIRAQVKQLDRDALKALSVTARLEGRDLGSAIAAIQEVLRTEAHLPQNVRVEFGGQYEQQQRAFASLRFLLVAAVGLVALVSLLPLAPSALRWPSVQWPSPP